MSVVENYLKSQGFTPYTGETKSRQAVWESWYKGYVREFHEYFTIDARRRKQHHKRFQLGMAKVVCEDFGSLLINEHVQIECEQIKNLADILEENSFHTRANRLAELTMAMGAGALVEFMGADGAPVIDYIKADMIYPLSWDNETVTECAFASSKVIGRGKEAKKGYYVQLHVKENGGWRVKNAWLDEHGEVLPAPEGMLEESPLSPVPLFQIVRPNTVNVLEPDSPLGASVFANAIDQLKACDIVYDSSVTEFVLGKKRVMIPLSLAQIDIEKGASGDDTISPSFDPNDMLFYVINAREGQDGKPIEIDMHLRVAEHDAALQRQIDLLSKKCGLGMGRYQVDGGALKTATEVISAKSDLYQSLKRHEKTFKDAIVGMVKAIGWLQGVQVDDVAVQFDDSIIEDANATIDREIKLVSAGLTSKKEAIMAIEGVDEKAAEAKLQAIAAEERISIDAAEVAMFGRMG